MGPQKIILFGGTFDPPHNGHMTLLAGAIEAVRPDLVLVEPAGTPPHKRAGGTSAAHRLAMCECFRPLFPELVLDTTEIARGGKSYTIDTVRQMNARYPGAQLYFPMGSDMLLWFRNWAAYRELLRRVERRNAQATPENGVFSIPQEWMIEWAGMFQPPTEEELR